MKKTPQTIVKYVSGTIALGAVLFFIGHFGKPQPAIQPVPPLGLIQTGPNGSNLNNFKGFPLPKDDIHIRFENRDLSLQLPIYYEINRYYLPITEILASLGGTQTLRGNALELTLNGKTQVLNLQDNTYQVNGQYLPLKKKALVANDIVYLSLFDFYKLFDLKVDWDIPHKTLALYYDRDNGGHTAFNSPPTAAPGSSPRSASSSPSASASLSASPSASSSTSTSASPSGTVSAPASVNPPAGKPALIRLEDIAAGHLYGPPEALAKLRIISDYLYQEQIPFHIAWVPRYIDPRPASKLDNDISEQYNMDNADFVFTLDYMQDRGGLIGLHGYTHQYGNAESIGGMEFHAPYADGKGIPGTAEYALERINAAKTAAAKLGIPYAFFEAPHYAIYGNQLLVAEKSFDYLYEYYPGAQNQITVKKNGDRITKFIPTPLDYVDGKKDTEHMIQKLSNLKPGVLASFFYHPYIDFDSITLNKEADGYPAYTYAPDSVLHRLLKVFKEKGYHFVKITDL